MKHVYVVTVMDERVPPGLKKQGVFFSRGHARYMHDLAVAEYGDNMVNMNATTVQLSDARTFCSELWARGRNLRQGLLKAINWR